EQPQDQGENHADENARDDGKIKHCILAAINNIARQPAQREIKLSRQQQHDADQKDHAAQNQQQFSQISHVSSSGPAPRSIYAAFSVPLPGSLAASTSAFS